jgi:hypothetical protein
MQNLFIDNQRSTTNENAVLKLIKDFKVINNPRTNASVKEQLFCQYSFSKCDMDILSAAIKNLHKTTYTDDKPRGSAMNPVFNGNWSVGNLGSMWCDMEVSGLKLRIYLVMKGGKSIICVEEH